MTCSSHAWNWTPGRWGFLWRKKGGHFWCYWCDIRLSQAQMDERYEASR